MKQYKETDKAIEFQSKIYRIKDLLQKLKKLELDTTKIEIEIDHIEKETANSIKIRYRELDVPKNHPVFENLLKKLYEESIEKLSQIESQLLAEYDTYYMIYSSCIELESKLSEITKDNILDYSNSAEKLLNDITTTTTIDYDFEKKLVEKVYSLVYQIIKLEIIYTKTSNLLIKIKENDIYTAYVMKCIQSDIDSLDLTTKSNQDIFNRINFLNKDGLQVKNLLDFELIYLLALATDEEFVKIENKRFLEECTEIQKYYTEIANIKQQEQQTMTEFENIIQFKKSLRRQQIKRDLFILGNYASLIVLMFGGYRLADGFATSTTYGTVTEEYDSRTGEKSPEKVYLEENKDFESTTITEYLPWQEPGYFRTEYSRDIYTYDVTNLDIDIENLEDYLTTDLRDVITVTNPKTETASEVAEQDLYERNYYIIKRITQNLDDPQVELNKFTLKILTASFSIVLFLADSILVVCLLEKYKHLRIDKKDAKQNLIATKKKLNELAETVKNSKEIFKELNANLLKEYDLLPSQIKQNTNIKVRVKKLKDDTHQIEDTTE